MKRRKRYIPGVSKSKPLLNRMWAGIPPEYSRDRLRAMDLTSVYKIARLWLLYEDVAKDTARIMYGHRRADLIEKILRVQNLKMMTIHDLNALTDQDLEYVCEVRGCSLSLNRERRIDSVLQIQTIVMSRDQDQWPER